MHTSPFAAASFFTAMVLLSLSPGTAFSQPSDQPPDRAKKSAFLAGKGQGGSIAADQPVPRTGANSKLAHQQMLDNLRKGRIDIYFVGDSITRRWRATDYQ